MPNYHLVLRRDTDITSMKEPFFISIAHLPRLDRILFWLAVIICPLGLHWVNDLPVRIRVQSC